MGDEAAKKEQEKERDKDLDDEAKSKRLRQSSGGLGRNPEEILASLNESEMRELYALLQTKSAKSSKYKLHGKMLHSAVIENVPHSTANLQMMVFSASCFDVMYKTVILRPRMMELWDKVFQVITSREKNSLCPRLIVAGTPGIGKSASAPYLLQRLLQTEMTVVLLIPRSTQKDGIFYIMKKGQEVSEWKEQDEESLELLTDQNTVLVIEPGEVGYDPSWRITCSLVLIASANEQHWRQMDKGGANVKRAVIYYAPLPTKEEAREMYQILMVEQKRDPNLDLFEKRYFQFGPSIRRLVGELELIAVEEKQKATIRMMTPDDVIKCLNPLNINQRGHLLAKTCVVAYDSLPDDFTRCEVKLLSPFVLSQLGKKAPLRAEQSLT